MKAYCPLCKTEGHWGSDCPRRKNISHGNPRAQARDIVAPEHVPRRSMFRTTSPAKPRQSQSAPHASAPGSAASFPCPSKDAPSAADHAFSSQSPLASAPKATVASHHTTDTEKAPQPPVTEIANSVTPNSVTPNSVTHNN